MKRMLALGVLLAAALVSAPARGGEPSEEKLTLTQRMYLDRLRMQLGLDDEQSAKVKALLAEEGRKTRDSLMRLLTEDQKAAFEKMDAEAPGRTITRVITGDGAGELGGFMPFSDKSDKGPFGLTVKELRKELGLGDEEAARLESIFKNYRKEKKAAFEKAAEGLDLDGMGKAFFGTDELDKKTLSEIRGAVGEAKREALDALVEKKREEGPVVQVFGGDGEELGEMGKQIEKALGEGLKGLGKTFRAKASSALDGLPSADEVCERAGFTGDEGEILKEKVKAVLAAKREFGEFMSKCREKLDRSLPECKDEDSLKARMAEFRRERESRRAAVAEREESLRSLLSFEQEAKLVAMGVLE